MTRRARLGRTLTAASLLLFSADHVMSWSTSVVSPPDGDMADYMRSLAGVMDQVEGYLAARLPGC